MKIGFDAKRLFLNNTGLGNYSRTLVRNLQAYHPEHQYFLYTPKVVINDSTRYFLDEDRFVIRENQSWLSSYWRSMSIVKDLQKDGIDVYHGLSHEIPLGLKKAGIPSCVTVHDLIYEVFPDLFNVIDRTLYRIKYRSSARRADRVIAISQSTSGDVNSIWGVDKDKIDVLYQSAGTEFFKRHCRPYGNRSHFLYVGSVIERKGLLDIIKAYITIKDRLDLPPFVVIGNGKGYFERCRSLIHLHELDSRFQFLGEVDNSKLIDYYDNAIALIYPSKYEGFGIPVIEAMLRKTPVICSDVSSMPEAGGPHSIYVEPGNINRIAEAMCYCIDNPSGMVIQTEKSYLYATENFNGAETAHSLLSIYAKLLK